MRLFCFAFMCACAAAADDLDMVQVSVKQGPKGDKPDPVLETVWGPQYTPEVMAFVHWTNELGVKKDEATCVEEAHHLGHYSAGAAIHIQANGVTQQTITGGDNVSEAVFCGVFGPSVVDANAGLVSVEHCNGVWRGAFAPFRNATGGFMPPEQVPFAEANPRYFVIWGSVTDGKFVADTDYTCIGFCDVDYEWTCGGGPIKPWGPQYSEEVMAFVKWTSELGVQKDVNTCADEALHLGHYSADASIHIQANGVTLQTISGGDAVSNTVFCGVFGPSVVDANAGLVEVEHCNGVWRGAFAPFRNATGGFMPPEQVPFAEAYPRYFVIWGSVTDGKLVADTDYTCVGSCEVEYPWACS